MTFTFHINKLLPILLFASYPVFQSCRMPQMPEDVSVIIQHLPELDNIRVDGLADDWPRNTDSTPIYSDIMGLVPDTEDFQVRFMLGWDSSAILVFAEITDDVVYEDEKKFWNGDGIELFISPSPGSFDILQISIRPALEVQDSSAMIQVYDHRRSDSLKSILPDITCASHRNADGYTIEGRIRLESIGKSRLYAGDEFALQLYFNDSDHQDDTNNYSLPWFPARESYRNPYAFHHIRFSRSDYSLSSPEVRAWIRDKESIHLQVLSDKSLSGLRVYTGDGRKRFDAVKTGKDLNIGSLELPLDKVSCSGLDLKFCLNDSLFFSFPSCLMFRHYHDIPEPNRFEDEILIFEILDHLNHPPENSILFTGSSTIRKWHNLEDYYPGLPIINRGFGGSTMEDLNFYASRIVFPYKPSRVYVYEGDNDIARGVSPEDFIRECETFIRDCRDSLPGTQLYFLSIKPSPARIRNWEDMQEANRLLSDLAAMHEHVHFVDISGNLLDEKGKPMKSLFVTDRLHFNRAGYDSLANTIQYTLYK